MREACIGISSRTSWYYVGPTRQRSSQVLPLDSGNLHASENISSREEYDDLPNSASQASSSNSLAHSCRSALSVVYVIRYWHPAAYDMYHSSFVHCRLSSFTTHVITYNVSLVANNANLATFVKQLERDNRRVHPSCKLSRYTIFVQLLVLPHYY